MKRDPTRQKAADLPDRDILSACEAFAYARGPHPSDVFSDYFPKNLIAAKLRKLEGRGLVTEEGKITPKGQGKLREAA